MFTFNGIAPADIGVHVEAQRQQLMAPQRPVTWSVSGRPGGYPAASEREVMFWEFDISFLSAVERDVAQWLSWPTPAGLIMDDDATKTYYARPVGTLRIARHGTLCKTTVTFEFPDPYSYEAAASGTVATGSNVITAGGNTVTYPKFTVTLDGDSMFLGLKHSEQDKTVLVGSTDDVDDPAVWGPTSILFDDFADLTGWTLGTQADGGVVDGTMECNGTKISPNYTGGSWGTGAAWHGPNVREAAVDASGNAIQDFDARARIGFNAHNGQTARIELYLLDAAADCIGKIALKDRSTGSPSATFEARAGTFGAGTTFANYSHAGWHDIAPTEGAYGLMQIERKGTHWRCQMGLVSARGIPSDRMNAEWDDVAANWTAPLKYVELHIASYGASTPLARAYVTRIEVTQLPGTDPTIPMIFESGKEIVVEMGGRESTPAVYYDGEPYMRYVDVRSEWFGLDVGANTIVVTCADGVGASGTVAFEPRWE